MTRCAHTVAMAPPISKRTRPTFKLTVTEAAILALVVLAILSALIDLALFMGLI